MNNENFNKQLDELIKDTFLINISKALLEISSKQFPFNELIEEFFKNSNDLSPNNKNIHIPKLIAIGIKIGVDSALLYDNFTKISEEINKRMEEEIEKKKDWDKGYI